MMIEKIVMKSGLCLSVWIIERICGSEMVLFVE
jgi:hypothetical protein